MFFIFIVAFGKNEYKWIQILIILKLNFFIEININVRLLIIIIIINWTPLCKAGRVWEHSISVRTL